MRAVKFKEHNVVIAEDQKEYKSLPAYWDKEKGVIVTCYKLNFKERIRLLFRGRLWFGVITFNEPLQPQCPSTKKSELLITNK